MKSSFSLMSLGLLMACLCGAAAGKGNLGYVDDTAQQNLIVANTEAPGADVMVRLKTLKNKKMNNLCEGSPLPLLYDDSFHSSIVAASVRSCHFEKMLPV